MTWTSLQHVVGLARLSRRRSAASAPGAVHQERRRHPATMGIDVPPVHGRHCICQRCEREARISG